MKKPKTKKTTNRCVDLMTKTCPTCGKKFCRLNWADYVYKDGQKCYCCYTCMRVAQKSGQYKPSALRISKL